MEERHALNVPKCITCHESFPGTGVRAASSNGTSSNGDETECLRCAHDKHTPKMYSSANNMNPGSVPPELVVSSNIYNHGHVLNYSLMHSGSDTS